MLNQPLYLLAGNCKSQCAACFPGDAKQGHALRHFASRSHQGQLVWGKWVQSGFSFWIKKWHSKRGDSKGSQKLPSSWKWFFVALPQVSHTPEVRGGTHEASEKSGEVYSRCSPWKVEPGLQVCVVVYTYMCMYKHMCRAFPSSFEAMLSAKLPWKIQRHVHHVEITQWRRSRREPLTRHFQAGNIFSSQMRDFEQRSCWYLSGAAPTHCWGGTGARASRFYQGKLQQTNTGYSFGLQSKFQSLLWPCCAAIPIFGFLPGKAGTDPWTYLVPRGCCPLGGCIQAVCATRWYQSLSD